MAPHNFKIYSRDNPTKNIEELLTLENCFPALIEWEDEDYTSNGPVNIFISYFNDFRGVDVYEIEHKKIGVRGIGITIKKAIEDFTDYLYSDYWAYVLSKEEDKLDKFAQRLADECGRILIKKPNQEEE
jgi:hypothetical protein